MKTQWLIACLLATHVYCLPAFAQGSDATPHVNGMTDAEAMQGLITARHSDDASFQGVLAAARGDLAAATAYYQQALKLDPWNYQALSGFGYVLEKEGRMAEARAKFRDALYFEVDHNNTPLDKGGRLLQNVKLRMHYVRLLLTEGGPEKPKAGGDGTKSPTWNDWKEAVYIYEDTIDLVAPYYRTLIHPVIDVHFRPDERDPTRLLAMSYVLLGMDEYSHGTIRKEEPLDPAATFAEAIKLQPNLAIAHFLRGITLGYKAEAKVEFAKAAALDEGSIREAAEKQTAQRR